MTKPILLALALLLPAPARAITQIQGWQIQNQTITAVHISSSDTGTYRVKSLVVTSSFTLGGISFSTAAITLSTSASLLLPFGSPGLPAIGFSTDSLSDIYHGPYGWIISGSTSPTSFPESSQIWLQAHTIRLGIGANQGNHSNAIVTIGSNNINFTDILNTGGTSSNNAWGEWNFSTFGITSAYHNSLITHGLAVGNNIRSFDGAANAASQTRVFRIVAPQTDGIATTGATYGIYIDSITANLTAGNPVSSGTAATGILNLSNYNAPNNDTYIALGAGSFGYTMPGHTINLTNNTGIWQAGNGGATSYLLLQTTNGDALLIGDNLHNSIQMQNNTVYFGLGAAQAYMQRGTLTVPYGVGAATGSFSGAVNVSGALTTTSNGGGVYTNSSPKWDVMNAAGTTGIRYGNTFLTPYASGVTGTTLYINGGATGNIGVGTSNAPSTFTVAGTFSWGSAGLISTGTSSGGLLLADSITMTKANGFFSLIGTAANIGVTGGGTVILQALNLAGNEGIQVTHTSGQAYSQLLPYSGGVAGTAMTLTGGSGGGIGVGTTAPATTFDVNGTFQVGSGVTKSTFNSAGNWLMPYGVKASTGVFGALAGGYNLQVSNVAGETNIFGVVSNNQDPDFDQGDSGGTTISRRTYGRTSGVLSITNYLSGSAGLALTGLGGSGGGWGINDSSPDAPLEIVSNNNGSAYVLAVSSQNDVTASVFGVTGGGHIVSSGTIPSIACNAGTPTTAAGSNDVTGTFLSGVAAVNCTVTFVNAWAKAPRCMASTDAAVPIALSATTTTTTLVVTAAAAMTGDNISYLCLGAP